MSHVYKGLVKPKLRENPDHIIIHVGTNELSSNMLSELLAESIVELVSTLKSDSCSVIISNVTVRNDKHRKKVGQITRDLKLLCQERNFQLTSYENAITEKHKSMQISPK